MVKEKDSSNGVKNRGDTPLLVTNVEENITLSNKSAKLISNFSYSLISQIANLLISITIIGVIQKYWM